ncbi:MAG: TonB-dependent receptor [Chitinophagaceae bacterium]
MRLIVFLVCALFFSAGAMAQHSFRIVLKDSVSSRNLGFATVECVTLKRSVVADSTGTALFNNMPVGLLSFKASVVGFSEQFFTQILPQTEPYFQVMMVPEAEAEGEEVIIVASSRTNSRIEDLATRVEVLGAEEVTEENGIKPGNITSLLGDIAGIQIQQTSATTGNADIRVQGLPGKYTQILRDGIPLYGGYSGSFSILQIPPLDLQQVELVKGSASTLYGGGAIAGMVNLVSKSPKLGVMEYGLTLNQSTLKESNLNIFLSQRNKKAGYSLFAGGNYQKATDVNKDGFSDVPKIGSFFIHPRLFLYPGEKDNIIIGYTANYEDRKGGDIKVFNDGKDVAHQFFIQNQSFRNTTDADWQHALNATSSLEFKGSASFFHRDITTNTFGMKANQFAYYSEATYVKKWDYHNLVAGVNFNGDRFTKKLPDSTNISNYDQNTTGLFMQDDWKIGATVTMQIGMRFDHHNTYGNFALPRLSVLYKINNRFSTRLGGGLGYKTPNVFSSELDERDYPRLVRLDHVKAERSYGVNWDINFKQRLDEWNLTVNQMFYITQINSPLVLNELPAITGGSRGGLYYSNAGKPLRTSGFETYIAARQDELELYLGYTYTVAKQLYNPLQQFVSLSARNKIAMVSAYEFSRRFRAGFEAAYTGKQWLDNGSRTPGYLFMAAMIRYNIGKAAIVLNCENLLDYRQTRKESIVSGNPLNPTFNQIWAPIDGRVVNLSVNFRW